jgi:hypothetical protein
MAPNLLCPASSRGPGLHDPADMVDIPFLKIHAFATLVRSRLPPCIKTEMASESAEQEVTYFPDFVAVPMMFNGDHSSRDDWTIWIPKKQRDVDVDGILRNIIAGLDYVSRFTSIPILNVVSSGYHGRTFAELRDPELPPCFITDTFTKPHWKTLQSRWNQMGPNERLHICDQLADIHIELLSQSGHKSIGTLTFMSVRDDAIEYNAPSNGKMYGGTTIPGRFDPKEYIGSELQLRDFSPFAEYKWPLIVESTDTTSTFVQKLLLSYIYQVTSDDYLSWRRIWRLHSLRQIASQLPFSSFPFVFSFFASKMDDIMINRECDITKLLALQFSSVPVEHVALEIASVLGWTDDMDRKTRDLIAEEGEYIARRLELHHGTVPVARVRDLADLIQTATNPELHP